MGDWLLIETAPRDGTQFLAYGSSEHMGCSTIAVCHAEQWSGRMEWVVTHDAEGYRWNDFDPTHWMPLPQPPRQVGDDQTKG